VRRSSSTLSSSSSWDRWCASLAPGWRCGHWGEGGVRNHTVFSFDAAVRLPDSTVHFTVQRRRDVSLVVRVANGCVGSWHGSITTPEPVFRARGPTRFRAARREATAESSRWLGRPGSGAHTRDLTRLDQSERPILAFFSWWQARTLVVTLSMTRQWAEPPREEGRVQAAAPGTAPWNRNNHSRCSRQVCKLRFGSHLRRCSAGEASKRFRAPNK
jgi:hypothetical protein